MGLQCHQARVDRCAEGWIWHCSILRLHHWTSSPYQNMTTFPDWSNPKLYNYPRLLDRKLLEIDQSVWLFKFLCGWSCLVIRFFFWYFYELLTFTSLMTAIRKYSGFISIGIDYLISYWSSLPPRLFKNIFLADQWEVTSDYSRSMESPSQTMVQKENASRYCSTQNFLRCEAIWTRAWPIIIGCWEYWVNITL